MSGKKGMISSRSIQYWLNEGYNIKKAEKMARSRMPGTIEYYEIYKGFSKEKAKEERKKFQNKRANTKSNFIKKYGKKEGTRRWNEYKNKQAYSNTLEYKKKKYSWSEQDWIEYNKSRGLKGKSNPNYKKGYYYYWVQEYGKEVADKMNVEASKLKAKGGYNQRGIPKSDEAKEKMKMSAIERVKRQNGLCISYNPKAIKVIEEYGKKCGYNFQHYENGGEWSPTGLRYSADGYDKEKNVWIEYMEKDHERQTQKDLQRRLEIMEHLQCRFIEIWYNDNIKEYEYEN